MNVNQDMLNKKNWFQSSLESIGSDQPAQSARADLHCSFLLLFIYLFFILFIYLFFFSCHETILTYVSSGWITKLIHITRQAVLHDKMLEPETTTLNGRTDNVEWENTFKGTLRSFKSLCT